MKVIVVFGNPMIGFSYVGTFDTTDDANVWADENVAREYDWWVIPIAQPEESTE